MHHAEVPCITMHFLASKPFCNKIKSLKMLATVDWLGLIKTMKYLHVLHSVGSYIQDSSLSHSALCIWSTYAR